jgi:hypothetical protein
MKYESSQYSKIIRAKEHMTLLYVMGDLEKSIFQLNFYIESVCKINMYDVTLYILKYMTYYLTIFTFIYV